MLTVLAVANYRSLFDVVVPLSPLNVICGANGTGKSNLYRALRLLADTAQGGIINALAREGGLKSAIWAGPEVITRGMEIGETEIQGGVRSKPVRLNLGFADDDFGYALSLGLPAPSTSMFALDPEIKRECIWAGPFFRKGALLLDRKGSVVTVRDGKNWRTLDYSISGFDSIFSQIADPQTTPEVITLRERILAWRFYDHFRCDANSPVRSPQVGTRTTALSHDGRDVAAAIQTIVEIGDVDALQHAIADAFPGGSIHIEAHANGQFELRFSQHGLLRSLSAAELSDGTLRYILWVAALLTPRPPPLMILNEPETSLHPDLLPALANLIINASQRTQLWVVSHDSQLQAMLRKHPLCQVVELEKKLGQTTLINQGILDKPTWHWP